MGYRPVTPNSLPICSETKVSGLFMNLGHGALGWTLAAATAKQIADSLN
jgi:D-amino-acid dehydrogenase